MRKLLVGVLGAVLSLTLTVSVASAQQTPWNVGIFIGALFPTGDLGGTTNLDPTNFNIGVGTGWLVGASGGYRFGEGQSPISLRLDLSYSSSSVKDDPNQPQIALDNKLNNITGLVYLLIHPNIGQGGDQAVMDLYAGGGGGFVNSKITAGSSGSSSESSTDGALSAVVGGAAPIGGLYLFFEGRWIVVFSEDTSQNLFPVVAGIRIPFGG